MSDGFNHGQRQLTFVRTKKKRRAPVTPESHIYAPVGESAEDEEQAAREVLAEPQAELDEEKPAEISKRDKRKAKESRRKAEEEAQRAALKDERKLSRKARPKPDTAAQQNEKLQKPDDFVTPKKKGKGRVAAPPDRDITEDKIAKAVEAVTQYRGKIVDRWGEAWTRECLHLSCHLSHVFCAYRRRLLACDIPSLLSIGHERSFT